MTDDQSNQNKQSSHSNHSKKGNQRQNRSSPRNRKRRQVKTSGLKRLPAVLLAVVLALTLALAACGGLEGFFSTGAGGPLTVVDDRGVEVTVDTAPERVVTVGPSMTEIVFAIGEGDLIVGIDQFSNWPDETESIEVVGSLREPNMELLVELDPDLIFMTGMIPEVGEKVDELGLTVIVFENRDVDHMYGTIERTGHILAAEPGAEALVEEMKTAFSCIGDSVGTVEEEERPTVFHDISHGDSPGPVWTAGAGSFPDGLIAMADGTNIFSDSEEEWFQANEEVVVDRNPEVITTTNELIHAAVDNRAGWGEIDAVRNSRIYILDDDLFHRPGPRLVYAFHELVSALWGERAAGAEACLDAYGVSAD